MSPPDDPLTLPVPPAVGARLSFPVLASLAPVLGGIVLWTVTGSVLALWFAALGPVIAVATLLDQARIRRRDRREGQREYMRTLDALERDVTRRHDEERERLDRRHPDIAGLAGRSDEVWRPSPDRQDRLVIGRGSRPSDLRISGSAQGRPGAEAVRARAAVLERAPVDVAWRTGIAVHAPKVLGEGMLRALVLQLCFTHGPQALRVVGAAAPGWEWLDVLPHRGPAGDSIPAVAVQVPGTRAPAQSTAVLAWVPPDAVIDPRCAVVVQASGLDEARVRGAVVVDDLRVEAVSAAQARTAAAALAARAVALYGAEDTGAPVQWARIADAGGDDAGGLSVAIGLGESGPVRLDLVREGPHAVVAGTTGSGKSELLTTWVTALSAAYPPERLAFLLADFKGGMTFQALERLPRVTGVLTDLDGDGALRAIASLRAEMRRREQILARDGLRDIAEADDTVPPQEHRLPRLVIVVDEFAALLGDHPDLHRVFSDVAARGRALGMHLVLGTQRASGVVRDALLANCPLRIVLRVAEAGESRALIGDDGAARIDGGPAGRGRALVRRAGDEAPEGVRIALTSRADIADVARRWAGGTPPRAAWLPPLPERVSLVELSDAAADRRRGGALLALGDDPEGQRRTVAELGSHERGIVVVGGPGSGKTGVAALIAAQHPGSLVVPRDPEAAWDTIFGAAIHPPGMLVVDDIDLLLARLPQEHGDEVLRRLEDLIRDAGQAGCPVVLTALRLTGALGRLADLLPRRAVLGQVPRPDRFGSTGAAPAGRPAPGRGMLDGLEVQFALPPAVVGQGEVETAEPWRPAVLTMVIARRPALVVDGLRAGWGSDVRVLALADLTPPAAAAAAAEQGVPTILVGDGESWQVHWSLLQALRGQHPLVVDAACATELRVLAGEREIPPYARPGAGRAWLCAEGASPVRVLLVPAPRRG
jgi:S-DNA-T family DNA segregation ATPase FtsK/SpoIIIE